jgi:hypothetical protein
MLARQTRDDLWTLISAPTVWALHFLICYPSAAVVCARVEDTFKPIAGVRLTIAVATAVALVLIAASGIRAWKEWRAGEGRMPHDSDTAADRERFLEFSTVLLAALSFVGVLFVAMPALVLADCR